MIRPQSTLRSLRWLGPLGAVALVAFHADLLRQRLADASITEPGVALRWLATLGVLAGLGWLARRGVPLLRDRRALVLWLVALLLHFGASPTVSFCPEWLALPAVTAVGLASIELGRRFRPAERFEPPALVPVGRPSGRPTRPVSRPRSHLPAFLPRPPPFRG